MNRISNNNYDIARLLFIIFSIFLLAVSTFRILEPFIFGFSWACMVVIATWPLMLRLEKRLWNSRLLSVTILILLLLMLFILPLVVIGDTVMKGTPVVINWFSNAKELPFPEMSGLAKIPFVGNDLLHSWQELTKDEGKLLLSKMQPYVGRYAPWLLSKAVDLGFFVVHAFLMLLFSALLYYNGESISKYALLFASRLSPSKGTIVAELTVQSIRAVALGVVVTAIVQSIMAAIGLVVTGISYATLLTTLIFVLCIIQLGPLFILVPCVIWLYWSGETTLGTLLLIWSGCITTLDGVMRPFLIKMGADLPLWLILAGVIGGILAFGMIGLFFGPVVLAIAYRLILAWMQELPATHK